MDDVEEGQLFCVEIVPSNDERDLSRLSPLRCLLVVRLGDFLANAVEAHGKVGRCDMSWGRCANVRVFRGREYFETKGCAIVAMSFAYRRMCRCRQKNSDLSSDTGTDTVSVYVEG